eukprot:CAMPEP_0168619600 /NCGR_PEP_ID=MMETSP0449_2-20121227/6688_1 /TAXON_ID=1082188 /ORGANISM="Strombidium rassoulzadegani, Strain ras09" /LENGTH=124 /DNA_ID=CAMNT_0008660545 /DNA_START=682 /DNA_END=1053 /DNA_ORIENTATION=-
MVEYIQDYFKAEEEALNVSDPSRYEGMDQLYEVPDESFEVDLDENFMDALKSIGLLKDVKNVRPKNFLSRPKVKKPEDQADPNVNLQSKEEGQVDYDNGQFENNESGSEDEEGAVDDEEEDGYD